MSGEVGVISAPSIFGKVPAQGDFIRHNASLAQVDAWRQWFGAAAGQPCRPGRHAGEPLYFLLGARPMAFPGHDFLLGVLVASRDRVGRPYPMAIWQRANAAGLAPYLRAPAAWLSGVAQIAARHAGQPVAEPLAGEVVASWERHRLPARPAWPAIAARMADRAVATIPADWPGYGMGTPAALRVDWPASLYRPGTAGCCWQAGSDRVVHLRDAAMLGQLIGGLWAESAQVGNGKRGSGMGVANEQR